MKTGIHKIFSLNPWLIIVTGFLLTIIFSITLFQGVEREKKSAFDAQVNWAVTHLQNRMEHYEGVLVDARARLMSSHDPSVEAFRSYLKAVNIPVRYVGLQGVGLALPVTAKELPALEEKMRKIYGDFRVWPVSQDDKTTMYPIVALEPLDGMNIRALGFNMASEEKRKTALELAGQSDQSVLSGKITLVQEEKKLPGFNLYLPVHYGESKKLFGFVYSPFRSEVVFTEILGRASPHITVEIFDDKNPVQENLLYRSPDFEHGDYMVDELLKVGGRTLLMRFRDHTSLKAGYSYGSVWLTGALGFFITIALFFLTLGSQKQIALVQSQLKAASNLRLRDEIIERSLNGFDIVNHEGKFSYVNPAYVKMWGYDSEEEIIGTSPAGHCLDPEVPRKIIGDLKTKGYCDIEFTALRKNGTTFEVRMLSFLAHDNEGNEIYPSTSVDISQNKNALRARDEFLSLASHELKTPLTTLVLQVQTFERLLEKNPALAHEPARHEKFVAMTRSQVKRLTRLVDDMLDVSRISTGKLSLQRESFDLRELLRDIVERMTPQFEAMKVQVPVIPEGEALTGNWDRLRIDQAIMNLMTNALKYGNGKPVGIDLGKRAGNFFVTIIDQGPGISAEAQKRVFNRYERAGASREISGLGLGLFLTRQIVEGHGGEVLLESIWGSGSRFTIILPPDTGGRGDIPIV